jgi:hypothetical protein
MDQQVLAFFTHILPCLAKYGVLISMHFNGWDPKPCALMFEMLNIFRDGLPNNKLHVYCSLTNVQYLPDIDNKMQKIGLYLSTVSDFPIIMKMLASPRPDGQQRVIYIPREVNLICILLNTIKEVKIQKKFFLN